MSQHSRTAHSVAFAFASVLILASAVCQPGRSASAQPVAEQPAGYDDGASPLDNSRPEVRILDPSACSSPITAPGTVTVRGISSDPESGIRKVEAFSHTYPFNGEFPFKMATPVSPGDWSSWSIPVSVYSSATRILVRATDNAGNENWDEITVDLGAPARFDAQNSSEVAFVDPSFTEAAYSPGGFYEFYSKYAQADPDAIIQEDLDLMTAEISGYPDRAYYQPIIDKVTASHGSGAAFLTDMDVNDGAIFRPTGENAFRVLFLLHNEYVTQQEYDNFRRFVEGGGTIVLIDGNTFYAEVSYDRPSCSVTLVKGHDWEFDGDFVRRSVSERFEAENREWVGTNYMVNALWDPLTFKSIPFNYTHFEENYVSNPTATILQDYHLRIGQGYDGPEWHRNATMAAYEMDYGKGKVLGLGIYGQNSANDTRFLDFFDKVILSRAFGEVLDLQLDGRSYPIYWKLNDGKVSGISVDAEARRLVVNLTAGSTDGDTLRLFLPKDLIRVTTAPDKTSQADLNGNPAQTGFDPSILTASEGTDVGSILVAVSAGTASQTSTENASVEEVDYGWVVDLPIRPGTSHVEVYGSYVAPEFGLSAVMLALLVAAAASLLASKFWHQNQNLCS